MMESRGKANRGAEDMTTVSRSRHGRPGVISEAWWLARQDAKWSWLSYPATALIMTVMGLLCGSSTSEMLGSEVASGRAGTGFEAFFPDFVFLMFGSILAVNWMAVMYLRSYSSDTFSERLAFFRGLPVPSASIVLGRAFAMVLALPLNTLAFFTPLYLLTDLGDLGWRYAWFVLFWVGYSLLGAGASLLSESSLNRKSYTLASFIAIPVIMVVLALLEWGMDLRLVNRIIALCQSHGSLLAGCALTAGIVGLGLFINTSRRRLERRDLG